jgi:hypothetical protein
MITEEVEKTKLVCHECITPCILYVDDNLDPGVGANGCPWDQTTVIVTPRWVNEGKVTLVSFTRTNVVVEVKEG